MCEKKKAKNDKTNKVQDEEDDGGWQDDTIEH